MQLNFFQPGRPITIYCDSGKKAHEAGLRGGFSALLFQKDFDGHDRLVEIASRRMTDVESRWGQTELEARAIKFACVDKFSKYLVGAPHFKIITDCKPLLAPFNKPGYVAPPRIERCVMELAGLDYEVVYQEGSNNCADFFSRAPSDENNGIGDLMEQSIIKEIKLHNFDHITYVQLKEGSMGCKEIQAIKPL